MRHMFLPVAAPAVGVTDECWGEQWMHVRRVLKIDDLNVYPLMPAPDSSLDPTPRPVSDVGGQEMDSISFGVRVVLNLA